VGNLLVSGFLSLWFLLLFSVPWSLLFLLLGSGRVLFFQEDFDSGRVMFWRGIFTGIFHGDFCFSSKGAEASLI
jgi:hypothetical protein